MPQMSFFDLLPDGDPEKARYAPKKASDWKWSFSDYPKEKNGITVFSCFACGGGSTMGYKLAGCDVLGCCEIDPKMNEVYVKNHTPKYNYLMDIRVFNMLENLPEELYNLDILDGSPPCTTFSMSGDREDSWGKKKKFREGQAEQTLDELSFVFIETAAKLKPKCVIMENVEGLLKGEAWSYVQRIYKEFDSIGYNLRHWLLKGEIMGIPQARHRVFFVAVRKDIAYDLDLIDMCFNYLPIKYGDFKDNKGERATDKVRELLEIASETDKDLVRAWNIRYNNGGDKRMFFNSILCQDGNVFPTISAGHNCLFDYKNKSKVSSGDIITAQTFPQDYDFIKNTFSNINYICGMSVPPIMIKRLVQRLIECGLSDYKKED